MKFVEVNPFRKQSKKLHLKQKEDLKKALKQIMNNPLLGEKKTGDIAHIRVHKFQMNKQLTLLAYHFNSKFKEMVLMSVGSYENFYRDLER